MRNAPPCGRVALASITIALVGCRTPSVQEHKAAPAAAAVKIVNFYARDPVLTRGESTVLCYGVENATAVHVEPAVDGVSPALSRCVEIQPTRTTEYKMIAEGGGWRVVSDPVTIEVNAAPVDASKLPRISSFKIDSCKPDYAGASVFSLSFFAQNADEIYTEPASLPTLHGAPFGHFGVNVKETTTYTLIAKDKLGHVDKKPLTLDVSKCK